MSSPSGSKSYIGGVVHALKDGANIHGDDPSAIERSVKSTTRNIPVHVLFLLMMSLDPEFMDRTLDELNKHIIEASSEQFKKHQDEEEKEKQPDMMDLFSNWDKSKNWGDENTSDEENYEDNVPTPPVNVNYKPSVFDKMADVRDSAEELAGAYKNLQKSNRQLRKEIIQLRNPNKTRGGAPKTFANSVDQRDPTPSESRIPQSRSYHRSPPPPLPAGTKWQTMPTSVKSKNSGVVAEKKENPQPNRELAKTSWKWFFLIKLGQRVRDTLPDLKDNWFRCEKFDDDHLVGWRCYKSGPYENYTANKTCPYQHSIRHDADKTNPTKWRHYKRTENGLVEFEDHIAFEEHFIASS